MRSREPPVRGSRVTSVTRGRPRRADRNGTARALRWGGGALVLLGVLFAARVLTAELPVQEVPAQVRDLFTLSISVFIESLPFVFLGTLLSIFVQLWLPPALFERLLPSWPPARRVVMSLFGVFLPVCECGNVPLARGLMLRGFTVAESLTFLLAAPILNPVTIITTYQAFGWENGILVGRIVGGFVIANLLGWLVSRHPAQHELLTPGFESACAHAGHTAGGSRVRRSAVMFAEEVSAMLPALGLGALLAGAIQVAVPRGVLAALGANPVWSVLALMALAFVVSVCSNVDAFFVLSFGSTFMPGAVIAFLVFGAMIDIKMLALLRTTFSAATLARVTLVVALCALVLGLAVNVVV